MSRCENIDNSFWADPDVAELSADSKYTYIWSWTNPRCGMAGIYKVSAKAAAFETGLPLENVENAFQELQTTRYVFFEDGVLWVRSRIKYIHSRTPQIAKSIASDLGKLPGHPLVAALLVEYRAAREPGEWLERLTSDPRGSSEPQVNLTRTSPEVPWSGTGSGSVKEIDAHELCELLSQSSRQITNTPDSSSSHSVTATWLREMDRLVRLDGRSPEQVAQVIRWAHADRFWRGVVLSPAKLRQHFDAISLKMGGAAPDPTTERRRAALVEVYGEQAA